MTGIGLSADSAMGHSAIFRGAVAPAVEVDR
jgi:hypothetical protein